MPTMMSSHPVAIQMVYRADRAPPSCRPRESREDQDVDERVLEEVDPVSEEGDRSGGERDGELDKVVGEIQPRDEEDHTAESVHGPSSQR